MKRKVGVIIVLSAILALFSLKSNLILAKASELEPILQYDFEGDKDGIRDKIGENDGLLHGKAIILNNKETNSDALYLNGEIGSYASFPEGFFDGKSSITISMDVLSKMDNQNFFTLAIGKDSSKYLFLRTRSGEIRYAITRQSYQSEQDVMATGTYRDVWTNVTLVMTSLRMQLYINGELADEQIGFNTNITQLGRELHGYIGKSFYDGDGYFKGYVDNIKIYDRALNAYELATMLNVEMNPFHKITAKAQSIVATELHKETREATIYISNSRSNSLEEMEIEFHLNEGVKLLNDERVILKANESKKVSFVTDEGYNKGRNKERSEKAVDERSEETDKDLGIKTWTVTVKVSNNPIYKGQYADPDIDLFGDKYYIYGTTDGFAGWSGTKFHVLSSDNLVDWVNEGVILDVASDDVKWAVGNAWAPSIEEKNGRYYFYFCAKDRKGDSSIGVAVANSPTGPFAAQDEPLITKKMCISNGIVMGQAIDPSIFTDDDGTSYMLFGNGNAAIVKLNDDMVSIDMDSLINLKGVKDFREAITVTKRDEIYHFTWSCDDTGSPNYHVNYGVSESIYGPIKFKYTILEKDTSKDILGTGHHSILHIVNTDSYYMVYHRFYTPIGSFTDGTGHHREICLDELFFDEVDGFMKPISPTHQGVKERILDRNNEAIKDSDNNEFKESTNGLNDIVKDNATNQDSESSNDIRVNKVIVIALILIGVSIAALIIIIAIKKYKRKVS